MEHNLETAGLICTVMLHYYKIVNESYISKGVKSNQVLTLCKLTISLIVFPTPKSEYGV